MTMARYDMTVTDNLGNVVSAASVEVRSEIPGQPLAPLYSDRAGTAPMTNPTTTDSDGQAGWYVAGGYYKIVATSGLLTRTRRYVGIGMAQGTDAAAEGLVQRIHTAAGAVTVTNDDADIIVVKKTVGAATTVNLPSAATTTKPVRIVDGKYDAATNNITIDASGTETIMGALTYVIDSNGASIKLTPLADGSGWI